MKEIIEQLFQWYRGLLGEGYDNAMEYLNTLLGLEIVEIPSGVEFGTWTVPDEWVIRDAWIKFEGKKILNFKKVPLSVVHGSLPFKGTVSLKELKEHLNFSDELPSKTPYVFKFYERDWGFCMPKEKIDKLKKGKYEVFIDSEDKPGIMKLGIHTVKGTSDREILLFAHLDHPYQANDNLSAVACLADLATKIKVEHTIKIVFCPETIGSIAYAHTQDLSNVDFMIAVDICGNNNSVLLQKSFNVEDKLNRVAGVAMNALSKPFRKGVFRGGIGSDEYVFNDPLINIPGILFTTHPYDEYHTTEDTPDKINYESIQNVQDAIMKTIEVYEKDFTPVKEFKGPLMRSRYGVQAPGKQANFSYDMFFYMMDGKRTLSELCSDCGINFDYFYDLMIKLEKDEKISRANPSETEQYEITS